MSTFLLLCPPQRCPRGSPQRPRTAPCPECPGLPGTLQTCPSPIALQGCRGHRCRAEAKSARTRLEENSSLLPFPTAGRYGKEGLQQFWSCSGQGLRRAEGLRQPGLCGPGGLGAAIPQCPPLGRPGIPAPAPSTAPAPAGCSLCHPSRSCSSPLPALSLHTPRLAPSGHGSPPLQQAEQNIELTLS